MAAGERAGDTQAKDEAGQKKRQKKKKKEEGEAGGRESSLRPPSIIGRSPNHPVMESVQDEGGEHSG